jgi:cyclic di-GMP phosphodiesterase
VRVLAAALELRDDGTGQHAVRVASLALAITKRVAPHLAEDLELEYGFLLHDIGKIGIPDTILLKPGPLNDDERLTMHEHPRLGERIIAGVRHLDGTAREIVICHHERWDGSGYPLGLAGEGIPLGARIFAIADAFDAMTNVRPYRPARSRQEAFAEIMAEAGRQFDPDLAPSFAEGFA